MKKDDTKQQRINEWSWKLVDLVMNKPQEGDLEEKLIAAIEKIEEEDSVE